MGNDILEGNFIFEPLRNPYIGIGIDDPHYVMAVVRIQMDDHCWYKVQLQRFKEDDEWYIGNYDIRNETEYMGCHIPYPKREELARSIVNFRKFKKSFLMV